MDTNRTVTSREYKLMLQADRFHDRPTGTEAFWNLVRFLVEDKQGNSAFKEPDKELRRVTWYLDTPSAELRMHGFVLRIREEEGDDKPFKVTLKYRDADRYIAASRNLLCREEIKRGDDKFEEDILPPFSSKFARSVSFKTDTLPVLESIEEVTNLFPGLDEWPLTAEFSFDYDLPKAQQKQEDHLEYFAPAVVASSTFLFRSLQKQVGWLDPSGTTKTSYAFDAL